MKKHLVGLLAVLSVFAVLAPMGASAQGNSGQALQTETTVVNVYAGVARDDLRIGHCRPWDGAAH